MKTPYSIALLSVLLASTLFAHVDDSGDIHPYVTVEDGRFAVYFHNSETKDKLKTTLGVDGKVIKARESVAEFPSEPLPIKLPEEQTGVNVSRPDGFYVIPEWHRKHDGKPYILRFKDGEMTRIDLAWGDIEIDEVHAAAFEDKFFILSASKVSPPDRDPYEPFPFFFFAFSRESRYVHKASPVGNPIRVYDFPMASEVLDSNGHSYVSWMGIDADEGAVLKLSRFDPETGRVMTKKISEGHGNSSPSIGIIDGKILIAFHKPTERVSYFGNGAKIIFKHRSLNELFTENRAEDGADQPATAPESKPEGIQKIKLESEGRSQ